MSMGIGFILGRAEATRAVQESMAGKWVWDEKTAEGWAADLAAVRAQQAQLTGLEQDAGRARADVDATLRDVYARTVQGLGMARAKYRNDFP
ncbi:MAG: hypothetical protein CO096_01350 [Armatimonadetes bacterium CG_4_9_14_3_um_filter_66_14]|nr:hypothetical protein [Armatimonadota bacterium]NCQ28218.1 hypothetical protein [Armatimonadota bacterium]PJB75867.1 MAG: hypothetical protein CO096_01350 [Armatimonadetes bacterium CG_4_9_14_3_um_filter_66_14]